MTDRDVIGLLSFPDLMHEKLLLFNNFAHHIVIHNLGFMECGTLQDSMMGRRASNVLEAELPCLRHEIVLVGPFKNG